MAQTRQFGAVPDLDDAPDIYETPELTDDTSTLPASTTVRSTSSASSYDDVEQDTTGIDRRRVAAGEARTRFEPARVNARDVDFSDKLVRQQKSYLVSRRRRRFADDAEELGDFSDDEEEPLDHRLVRLRQEIEQVKAEMQSKSSEDTEHVKSVGTDNDGPSMEAQVQELSELLDSVYTQQKGHAAGAEAQYMATLQRFSTNSTPPTSTIQTSQREGHASQPQGQSIATEQHTQLLNKASEVDQRLTALETVLGLDSSTLPDSSPNSQKPIIYMLNNLDRQLTTLSSSTSSDILDTASHRVRQLTQEADRLAEKQRATSPSTPTTTTSPRNSKISGSTSTQEPDSASKINALFGTLHTIESLSPLLPMVLERLRTLRLMHVSAGDAGTILDVLEKRQAEQASEIERWQEALQKVESSMSEGEGVVTENVKLVSEWVKELEARVEKLH